MEKIQADLFKGDYFSVLFIPSQKDSGYRTIHANYKISEKSSDVRKKSEKKTYEAES